MSTRTDGFTRTPWRSPMVVAIAAAIASSNSLAAPDPSPSPSPSPQVVEFDTTLFGRDELADISRLQQGASVAPGVYSVDLYVNRVYAGRRQVTFQRSAGGEATAEPCSVREDLLAWGVNVARMEEVIGTPLEGCLPINRNLNGAAKFDVRRLRLDLEFPQAYMLSQARGFANPELRDAGISALFVGYNLNVVHGQQEGRRSTQDGYLGLNAGLNVGGWRFRSRATAQWNRDDERSWNTVETYAQHDVPMIDSQLRVGDTFTSGGVFDTTAFRGMSLATDTRMRPETMNGYAPVVRGMADSNASVEIRQNGFLIYETSVSAGPFEITDLYSTGQAGDLLVTVIEADGRRREFTVPYAYVPRLLRPGVSEYSFALGEVRDASLANPPGFIEATYLRGLTNLFSAYGGFQATQAGQYRSMLLGAAMNTPIGALSLDVTQAETRFDGLGQSFSGMSAKATFSRSIPSTNTDFALAAYRYSEREFFGLNEAVRLNDSLRTLSEASSEDLMHRQRRSLQLTVSQKLGESMGSLYLSGSKNAYWNGFPSNTSYQVGYSRAIGRATLGLSASRTRLAGGQYDDQYYLNLTAPLGRSTYGREPLFTATAAREAQGNSLRATVSGAAGRQMQTDYQVSANAYSTTPESDSVSGALGWRTPVATVGTTYTYASSFQRGTVNVSGGVVAHAGGVTLAPRVGENMALIQAKDAGGAYVNGSRGARVDGRGYAVVTGLSAYRFNDVTLDPKGLAANVELSTTRLRTVPTAGAVVALAYETRKGYPVLFQLTQRDGQLVPFGAVVEDAAGNELGYVGSNSSAFVRVPADSEPLRVYWGKSSEQRCTVNVKNLPSATGDELALHSVESMCL